MIMGRVLCGRFSFMVFFMRSALFVLIIMCLL
jgi:hypothetical protein